MSTEVDVYETLSDNVVRFDNKDQFIAYYKMNSKQIDEMPTRGLNIKYQIKGYKLGRKGGKITLIPTRGNISAPIEEKPQPQREITESKRSVPPPKRKESKRKYYSYSSEEDYSDESSDSEDDYYRRKEMKKHSRKPTNSREAMQKAAYRASNPGRKNLPPEKKMNKLNGRVKQLEMAMNDMYNRFDQPQKQQMKQQQNESSDSSESDSSDYSSSED